MKPVSFRQDNITPTSFLSPMALQSNLNISTRSNFSNKVTFANYTLPTEISTLENKDQADTVVDNFFEEIENQEIDKISSFIQRN